MKTGILFLSLFFIVSCIPASQENGAGEIKVFGKVYYGIGKCLPGKQNSQIPVSLYSGEIYFIKKQDIEKLVRDMESFISSTGGVDVYSQEQDKKLTLLKDTSSKALVQQGKYSLYVSPGNYYVVPNTSRYLNNEATFSTGSVTLGRDFRFYECE